MSVKPIPDGYNAVTPFLLVDDAAKEIEFIEKAFGGECLYRMDTPNGTTHAEIRIRDSIVMVGQSMKNDEYKAMPMMLYLYVDDVDKAHERAVKAGGEVSHEVSNQFYGDRAGAVKDANGNQWWLATHIEDVSPEELSKRAEEAYKSGDSKS